MDPTTLIVTALTSGAAANLKDSTSAAIKDTYAGLKTLLQRKYNDNLKVQEALIECEEDPQTNIKPLEQTLRTSNPDQDEDILNFAYKLIALIQTQEAGTGKNKLDMVNPGQEQAIGGSLAVPRHSSHKDAGSQSSLGQYVFVSYKHEDGDFAELLINRMKTAGFETWVDNDKLHAGDDWRIEIDQAIKNAFALILIMSPDAKASEYVTYEWAFAWGAGVRVIPVVLKHTELHPRLEALQHLDFTNRNARQWDKLIEVVNKAAPAQKSTT